MGSRRGWGINGSCRMLIGSGKESGGRKTHVLESGTFGKLRAGYGHPAGLVTDGIESRSREGAAMECTHLDHIHKVKPSAKGCEDCLKIGSTWVHLRMCMECGHVGCCDSSPNKHATKHFHKTKHPIMRSIEPGESWGWCYIDEIEVDEAWPS
jgi:hypothetical protein